MTHINPINRSLSRAFHDHGEFSRCQFEPETTVTKRKHVSDLSRNVKDKHYLSSEMSLFLTKGETFTRDNRKLFLIRGWKNVYVKGKSSCVCISSRGIEACWAFLIGLFPGLSIRLLLELLSFLRFTRNYCSAVKVHASVRGEDCNFRESLTSFNTKQI